MKSLLFAIILAVLMTGSIAAHPPQDINGEFNLSDKTLTFEVTHRGGGGSRHYVETITVTRNDNEILKHEVSSQSKDQQPFTYLLPDVAAGDQLTITATCSISGSRQLNLTVR